MNRFLTLIICAVCTCAVSAQQQTIADHINSTGSAMVFQPSKLNARLMSKMTTAESEDAANNPSEEKTSTVGGFRIQLFSGNNARTAQSQANNRASRVNELFPEYPTYVTFIAPYWRLKVGNFRTYEDATAAMSRLKAALPEFAAEMRLVRDRINIQ